MSATITVPGLGELRVVGTLGGSVRRCATDGGADLVVKTGPGVAAEAAGLARLAVVEGGPPVPSVLYAGDDLLVTSWVPPGLRSDGSERALGAGLAALHETPTGSWGGGSPWIGDCCVDPMPAPTAAEFYGVRLDNLLARAGMSGAGPARVSRVISRLESLVPPSDPRLLHGDLWWGNVLWSPDGPVLIDPSVHGGHPEEDLAMLALFGPVPAHVTDSYLERRALEDGWRQRVALWQLYPLLVHAVLFGGSYRGQAEAAAASYH